MISEQLQNDVQQTLNAGIKSIQEVSGGSINHAAKIVLTDERSCFLKWNSSANPDMFLKEKKGLALIQSAGTSLRVPKVFATGKTSNEIGFLVQEFITEAHPQENSAAQFGRKLAKLHRHDAQHFGLDHNNYIGKLPQPNKKHKNWVDFFIEQRMKPQIQMAIDSGKLDSDIANHFEEMYNQLPDIFPDEPPALLHGDLWSGNYFYDETGGATIFDPAVYYGHREIELAFTHLFGGFSTDFYHSYEEHFPLEPGFSKRKDIYNLYPLLVHTNLFGGSYARQVASIVAQF